MALVRDQTEIPACPCGKPQLKAATTANRKKRLTHDLTSSTFLPRDIRYICCRSIFPLLMLLSVVSSG